jgi:retron-type reverse transcriptase
VENRQPKEVLGSEIRTSGLPKVENDYGNGGIIVPNDILFYQYSFVKTEKRGRISSLNIRMFHSAAGSSSTVESDSANKLLKLANYCEQNPNETITDPIYRLMYNPRLYEMAYHKIKSKPGNMTPGIVPTTLDGMSSTVINEIIESLKNQTFHFAPGRRIQIPKSNGGKRPLTIAPPRDKLVQEVMRIILEIIFEPTFSESSHGFRAGRSCHTALKNIKEKFGVATCYIEGDIAKCFDSINHNKLMEIVEHKIKDRRFTRLIRKALNAGYFEFKQYKHSIVGTPQGSIISPILCNIFMDKLDKFIENLKKEFDRGEKAKINPA